ncbi:K+ channel tetramerisation domain containing protein, putative [Babesia bigemina]|uniref:K+ channel tetramerisation domain containing protein, putative n=1 Tax=Babesia bigemina TaxID=5866 RepID=A0A061D3P6_BABBI|nr:K+ channel tetramerisation domain containing protein, putative [Babesia bigemina]CDR95316.1 K+ channel tetramerisation domain containing protein, putative [Babesia bigemina]|eukprot:XP_012767502.1 K+ channel tetramerisation domain containing protein, putative [Babesia bigemina]
MVHSVKKQCSDGAYGQFDAPASYGTAAESAELPPIPASGLSEVVNLNVGGVSYVTTYRTLLNHKGSRFATYFRQLFAHLYQNAPASSLGDDFSYLANDRSTPYPTVFIDRDGRRFSYVLDYLRDGSVALPDDQTVCRGLLTDAQYFRLSGLEVTIAHTLQLSLGGTRTPSMSHSQDHASAAVGRAPCDRASLVTHDAARTLSPYHTASCSHRMYSVGSAASTSGIAYTCDESQSAFCSQQSYDEDLASSQKSFLQVGENDNIEDAGMFVQTTPLSRLGKTEFSTNFDF